MALLAKVGLIALTVGTCATAGCIGGIYLSGTPIKDLINNEFEYKLLDTTAGNTNNDKTIWETIWKEYKSKSQNVFKLEGWKVTAENFDLTEKLKEKCKELSETKVSNSKDDTYVNVTKYCARRITFEEQARKDKLEILDTSGASHATIWTNRHGKKTTIAQDLKKLGIDENPSSGDVIKTGCGKAAKEKNKQIKNYKDIYASYKLVCTKQKEE